jgi:hypothetical protein
VFPAGRRERLHDAARNRNLSEYEGRFVLRPPSAARGVMRIARAGKTRCEGTAGRLSIVFHPIPAEKIVGFEACLQNGEKTEDDLLRVSNSD